MKVKNKYIIYSQISKNKFREIIRLLILNLSAIQISEITHISRVSINKYLIARYYKDISLFDGIIEVDKSYLGAKRARGTSGKIKVLYKYG